MRVAVWDIPPADALVAGLTAGGLSADAIVRGTPEACEQWLRAARVDVALLPSVTVLTHPDVFDALPAVALSAWRFPYARLALRHGFAQPITTLAFNPDDAQAALLARIILREHYAAEPAFVAYPGHTAAALLDAQEDAALLVGNDVPTLRTDRLTLDLGQEWAELVNYPVTWGLFAVRKDEGEPSYVDALRGAATRAETRRGVWVRAHDTTPDLHAFFTDDLRVRLDDLAIAGLTELRQFLYYLGITEEVPDLPLYELPGGGDEADDEDIPLL